MKTLMVKLTEAVESKPAMGEACTNCGYCCLTEVCVIGQELTGKRIAPCNLLIEKDNKYFCKLILNGFSKEELGIGTGCCAETQNEAIVRLTGSAAQC